MAEWKDQANVVLGQDLEKSMFAWLPLVAALTTGDGPLVVPQLRYDCADTSAGLEGTAIACPPVDDRLLGIYFDHLVRSGAPRCSGDSDDDRRSIRDTAPTGHGPGRRIRREAERRATRGAGKSIHADEYVVSRDPRMIVDGHLEASLPRSVKEAFNLGSDHVLVVANIGDIHRDLVRLNLEPVQNLDRVLATEPGEPLGPPAEIWLDRAAQGRRNAVSAGDQLVSVQLVAPAPATRIKLRLELAMTIDPVACSAGAVCRPRPRIGPCS